MGAWSDTTVYRRQARGLICFGIATCRSKGCLTTYTDIVNTVADRLNLTSATALTRIGTEVNERYRWLASSIGIDTIERLTATADTVIDNQSVTFGPTPVKVQKLLSVFNANFSPPNVLDQVTFDELRNSPALSGDVPRRYAVQLMGADSVTIFLDMIPGTVYELSADVLSNRATLSGSDVPAFAEDYHNALVYGVLATELRKMEKYAEADIAEKMWFDPDTSTGRVADLRMFIAKSGYLKIYQGRNGADVTRWSPLVS